MKSIALKTAAGAPTKKKALAKKAVRKRAAKGTEMPEWIRNPDSLKPIEMTEEERAKAIDEILDEAQREKIIKYSCAELLEMSRR